MASMRSTSPGAKRAGRSALAGSNSVSGVRPEQVPAAGTLPGVDGGLAAGDGKAVGRHRRARRGAARQVQPVGQATKIRKAGQEADQRHVQIERAERGDDFAFAAAGGCRDFGQIRPELAAKAHRHDRGRGRSPYRQRRLLLGRLQQRLAQAVVGQAQGIEMHGQRAPGRHHVGDAVEAQRLQLVARRHDARVGVGVDALAEFEGQRAVA
jgi:hypothetical protein